jgi:predicted RNA-binding Zn ribbon-like protein
MVATVDTTQDVSSLELCGGHAALDFVNTIEDRLGPGRPIDFLVDFAALCEWAGYASLIDAERAAAIAADAKNYGTEPDRVWKRAVELREALYRVLTAIVDGSDPERADLDRIDRELGISSGHVRLGRSSAVGEKGEPAFVVGPDDETDPEAVLCPIAQAILDLLTNVDASRLRICPGSEGGCGWVVLDTTRNRSRRWCDMGSCGSEAKSKRLTERRREARKASK